MHEQNVLPLLILYSGPKMYFDEIADRHYTDDTLDNARIRTTDFVTVLDS